MTLNCAPSTNGCAEPDGSIHKRYKRGRALDSPRAGAFEVIGLPRQLLGIYLATLNLLSSALIVATPASAAAVDLDFALKPGEDTSCRQWAPNETVSWNFTLAMNGTDSSLITTPTYVWIDDSGAPAMQDDGWIAILAASGNFFVSPPSYDAANSNDLATAPALYSPSDQGMDLYLYSGAHPAPVTNITLIVTGSSSSENKNHYLNISARTHRQGTTDITRTISLCIQIAPNPNYEMGARDARIEIVADATVTAVFWLKNTGNTLDFYFCNVSGLRSGWTARFSAGIRQEGGVNFTNFLNISQNITIRVEVTAPPWARAGDNSTIVLNCTSYKGMLLGLNLSQNWPQTRLEIPQVYLVTGQIPAGIPSLLAGLPGDTLRFDFMVRNRGNGRDRGWARLVGGSLPGWSSWPTNVTPSDFDLGALGEPGSEEAAQFVVTIPEGTPMLVYNFTVNMSSVVNGTPVTSLRFHVNVMQVYRPLVSSPAPQVGVLGDELVFNFTITNGGNGLDSLVIGTTNLSGWRVLLSPPMGKKLLESDDSYAFQATVSVPAALRPGIYDQRIRISSEYAALDLGLTVFAETNLTVIFQPQNACGFAPLDAALEGNPRILPGSLVEAKISFALFNLGLGSDRFTLSAAAPAALTVTFDTTHAALGLSANVSILVTARTWPFPVPGLYEVAITATSDVDPNASCSATVRLEVHYPPGPPLPTVLNLTINGVATNELQAGLPALFEIDLADRSNYTVTWRFDGGNLIFPDRPELALLAGPHTISVLVDNGTSWRVYAFEVVALSIPEDPFSPPLPTTASEGASFLPVALLLAIAGGAAAFVVLHRRRG